MADDSTIRVQRMRHHRNGNHEFCNEENCPGAYELSMHARHVINSRAILEFCLIMSVPWEYLGDELADIRALARQPIPEPMRSQFTVDITELNQARFTTEELLRETGHRSALSGPLPPDAVSRIGKRA